MGVDSYRYLISGVLQTAPFPDVCIHGFPCRDKPIPPRSGIAVWGGTTADDVAIAEPVSSVRGSQKDDLDPSSGVIRIWAKHKLKKIGHPHTDHSYRVGVTQTRRVLDSRLTSSRELRLVELLALSRHMHPNVRLGRVRAGILFQD